MTTAAPSNFVSIVYLPSHEVHFLAEFDGVLSLQRMAMERMVGTVVRELASPWEAESGLGRTGGDWARSCATLLRATV